MTELRLTIANNIKHLRCQSGLTQAELAQKLNYSDKSVSKWERAEGLPDIVVLKQIADMHGVSVDWLLCDHGDVPEERIPKERKMTKIQKIIVMLSILGAFFVALVAFFIGWIGHYTIWGVFIYCIPISFILLIVFNSIWGRHWITFYYISGLIWSVLLSIYIATYSMNLWLIFVIGIPLELATILSFRMIPRK